MFFFKKKQGWKLKRTAITAFLHLLHNLDKALDFQYNISW